jgi:hypothetical protein
VAFERDSKLLQIDTQEFATCSSLTAIFIPRSVAVPGYGCFASCRALSLVRFESGSGATEIGETAISISISIMCIPSCIEVLCEHCFSRCENLSVVTFDSGSRLRQIDDFAFSGCRLLSEFCVPSTVEILSSRCLTDSQAM